MIYTLLTNKAMRTAYAAHAGQVDKCGVPYIFHPIHLAEQMPDEISVCAALLHDVAEDTDITLSELESEFPSAVIDVLKLLTHKDGIDYFDYIRAIRSNPTAVRVKLADIAHNSDETRYAGCSEIDAEQLAARRAKYKKAKALLNAVKPNDTECSELSPPTD
ncbi:MAG TPA: GTP pyrophosphokinase [Clostridiales bacterium]|nr:GTP pyrophosphokinase [Clostridiales bacterium]